MRGAPTSMRVLVTGGTGFIGARVVALLLQEGHEVTCLVRSSSPAATALASLGAALAEGDVTEPPSLTRAFAACEAVVHCAALYSTWEADPSRYTRVNEEGTEYVMWAAQEEGIRKAVLVSTALVYGEPTDCPFTEESRPGPVRYSAYVESKYRGERQAWRLHREAGLPLAVVYPGAVIGPGDPNVTGDYIRRLLSGTLPARVFEDSLNTYVYVDDVARGIVAALEHEGNEGERYLLGRYRASYAEYNRMIAELAGIDPPLLKLPDTVVRVAGAGPKAAPAPPPPPPPVGPRRGSL